MEQNESENPSKLELKVEELFDNFQEITLRSGSPPKTELKKAVSCLRPGGLYDQICIAAALDRDRELRINERVTSALNLGLKTTATVYMAAKLGEYIF